ncbi:MAG: extracellular solute-binding protein [Candidatus Gastranaerophilales bacterium]|nr:extracellular solute-binding protein [Candidatus Gastranaerophilales bacterium]
MKKNRFKKALCVGLAAIMTAGLCACGGGGKKTQDPSLAKQYVYSYQEFKLPDIGDDNNITTMAKIGDRIYILVYVYHWKEDGQNDDMRLFSVKEDGSDVQEVRLEMPVQESVDESGLGEPVAAPIAAEPRAIAEGVADLAAASVSIATEPEEPAAEPEEEPAAEPEETESEASEEEGTEDAAVDDEEWGEDAGSLWEYTSYSRYCLCENGLVYAIKDHTLEDGRDPENWIYTSDYFVCAWDLDGKLLFEEPLEMVSGENSGVSGIQTAVADKDGNYMMMAYNWETSEVYRMVADKEGNVEVDDKPMEDERGIFSNLSGAYAGADGQVYLFYYDPEDDYNLYIAAYDIASNSVSEGENGVVKMPASMYYSGYNALTTGIGNDLLFTNSDGVYAYNFGDADVTPLMSFVNSDLDTNSMYTILALDENRIMGFYYDRENYESVGGIFTKVNPEDIPDKEVIVVAGESLRSDLLHRIVEFNRSSDAYRIVAKTYESYITSDNYMAGYDQLSADILAGNMPDILFVDSNTDIDKYISKGLLADVGKLIKEDEELSQVAFMENVFDAYRRNGKLYQVIPAFSLSTVVGKQSIVGDRTTWTMQDFMDLMASMPEGTQGFGELTRSDFLNQAFNYCGSDFVDVDTGKCSFDTENFITLLEYAATLPEEIDWENYNDDYWSNYESLYRTDQILLSTTGISDPNTAINLIGGTYGEDISYIGFPTDSGQGSYVYANTSYVLSARSAHLDGAWEFVRYYLLEEYQKDQSWPLPIREEECIARMASGLEKPWYEDENGEKVEYDYTYWMNGEVLTLDPLTQEQYDKLITFIKSVDKAQYSNDDIWNIVLEEAEAFFSGQKSARDVAGIIQNRAQVYVDENS